MKLNLTENDRKLIIEALTEKAERNETAGRELCAYLNARNTPEDYEADNAAGSALIKEANRVRSIAKAFTFPHDIDFMNLSVPDA